MNASVTPFTTVDLDLTDHREGKVRSSYRLSAQRRLFVTTDRLSAFDRVIAGVPYKGQVLNQLSWWWFKRLADIVAHHALAIPDPNALVAVEAEPLSVEVIVRQRITGVTSTSLWQQYCTGARVLYGHHLPDGLQKNDLLPEAIITPTTKAVGGAHDEALTCDEVVSHGFVAAKLWQGVQEAALAIFAAGRSQAAQGGLELADTKYEFGLSPDGQLMLIDEVHTPDSSRYWVLDTLEARLAEGLEPESLDKEVVRRAFADVGWKGDGPMPELPSDVWLETSKRYIETYERLTGEAFVPGEYPVMPRLARNIGGLT